MEVTAHTFLEHVHGRTVRSRDSTSEKNRLPDQKVILRVIGGPGIGCLSEDRGTGEHMARQFAQQPESMGG